MHRAEGNPLLITRRGLLRLGGGCVAAGLIAHPAEAARRVRSERVLALTHTHTGETVRRVYWADGRYVGQSLREIYRLLRDHRTDEVRAIDVKLLDLLHDLHRLTGSRKPFEIISAYRSPATNAHMRETKSGVARQSFHMQGKAIDLRLPDRDLGRLRQAAMRLDRGGVGYYPSSDFVHVDVGPARHW